MATVYLAVQESFQREVALKIMSPSLSEDSEFSERFLREARIVSRLVHPNIVTVHDVGIDNGRHYLSMEYIEGQDLKQCLPGLSGEQLFGVMRDMAKALDYAGSKGYVHRDVKPENIMLHSLDGRAVLMDFGIARAADAATSMTRTGTALGTPHYMSPEQARGHNVDGRSDLYSLGVLFYYMLMGRVPYEAESPVAIGIKHISEAIPRLPTALADYQPLVDKLMAKKLDDRYQTGGQLLIDLDAVDVAALDRWRSTQRLQYSDDQQRTPLRNEAAELIFAEEDETDKTSMREARPGGDETELIAVTGPEPDEALHIPREDLEARLSRQSNSGWALKALLLLVMLMGGGLYFYDALLPVVPEPVAGLLVRAEKEIKANYSLLTKSAAELNAANNSAAKATEDSATHGPGRTPAATAADRSGADAPGISPVEQLLDRSKQLASVVAEQPDRMRELVELYRDILALDAEHPQALQALAEIKRARLADIASLVDSDDLAAARQRIEELLTIFPNVDNDNDYRQLEQRLQHAEAIATLLAEAEQFLADNRLIYPLEASAKQRYEAVLARVPEHAGALQGLEKVAERYSVLARAAQRRKDYQKAQTHINNGLSIKPDHQTLLALQKDISAAIDREREISGLLQDAASYEQQQQWFGTGDNAAQRYLAVQSIDPQRQEAASGLNRILDNLYVQLDALIAVKDYERAGRQIQAALATFPNNDRLLSLLLELESYKPVIENLRLSGKSTADLNVQQPATITVDRTLHVAFAYRNLDQPTTVLQVLLFDGGRSVQIAAAPVVVVGSEGDTRFRIDRPVEGFTDGGYHLDVLLAGQQIFTHAFVLGH